MQTSRNRTTLYNIASTIVLQGLTFLSGPIFSGILGTENYGIAAVYLTWVTLASTFFSLQAAGTIAVARIQYPEEIQAKYQSSVLGFASLSYFAFSVVTISIVIFISRWVGISIRMVLFGLVHGWGMYCVSVMNLKLTYEFKADKNFMLSVVTSVTTIGLSIFLIRLFPSESNYWGRIIGQSIAYAVIGAGIFIYILQKGRTIYNKEFWKFTLPIAIPTIFHSLAGIILNQSDKVMLQNMVSNSAAGIYALACTFGTVVHSVWNAFNNSWVPYYYEYTKQNQIDEMKKHAKNYINLFTIIVIGFVLLSREVFHVYANYKFWKGTDLISIFALGHYFTFLYSFPVNFEFYNKKTRNIAVGTTLAAGCNIILNCVFIKLWGITGAVVATVTSQGIQFWFHFLSAKHIDADEFPFCMKDFCPGLLAVAGVCILNWFVKDYWVIRWSIAVGLGSCLLFRIIKRKEIF